MSSCGEAVGELGRRTHLCAVRLLEIAIIAVRGHAQKVICEGEKGETRQSADELPKPQRTRQEGRSEVELTEFGVGYHWTSNQQRQSAQDESRDLKRTFTSTHSRNPRRRWSGADRGRTLSQLSSPSRGPRELTSSAALTDSSPTTTVIQADLFHLDPLFCQAHRLQGLSLSLHAMVSHPTLIGSGRDVQGL